MIELVVESGKIYEKRELSSSEVAERISMLENTIAELTAEKAELEAKQAEVAE